MRILHFADLHIGVENYSRVDPETGLSTRLGDFLETYDEVVSYALENRVDLVLFCGDAYKNRDPSQTHQREFATRIARLSNEGIPVFLLVGNHDTPHVIGRATALEIFRTLDVSNVHIGDSVKISLIETPSGPVQVLGVPWIRRSAFLAQGETRGLTPDQVNEAIQERLARTISTLAADLDPGTPAVLAGHVSIGSAKAGSEQWMMLGRDHVLLKSDVALPQFDYVALGHVHRHQILGYDPHLVYSGSLQRIDFGEERDDKGFCIVDLDETRPAGSRLRELSFQKVKAREFLTISVDVPPGDPDPTATVIQAISRHHIEGAVVKLNIKLPADLEGHLREREVREALGDAHFVASVSKEVIEQRRNRLGAEYSKGLDPRNALRSYLDDRNVAKDRAEQLMQRAEELMEEHARERIDQRHARLTCPARAEGSGELSHQSANHPNL